ncbi:MAG: hypothetical protein AAGK14_15050 [Verrucomicrobiota bacterium]
MNLSPEQVFALYLAVFLAVIFGSWFIETRRRRRGERGERRVFVCGFCQARIPAAGPSLRLRCPQCQARLDRRDLRAADEPEAATTAPTTQANEVKKEKN